jgi:hypothetical protein
MNAKVISNNCETDQRGNVEVALTFSPEQIHLQHTPFGTIIEGEGFDPYGEPGEPAFPACFIRVAIPTESKQVTLNVESRNVAVLSDKPVIVSPVFERRVGNGYLPPKPSGHCLDEKTTRALGNRKNNDSSAIPSKRMVSQPNFAAYEKQFQTPYPLATITSQTILAGSSIVAIRVMPVHYDTQGRLVLRTDMQITVRFGDLELRDSPDKERQRVIHVTPNSLDQHNHLIDSYKDSVINGNDLHRVPEGIGPFRIQVSYLILTDNNSWDPNRIAPLDAIGDLVSEFEKLAVWKRRKGLTARSRDGNPNRKRPLRRFHDRCARFTRGASEFSEVCAAQLGCAMVASGRRLQHHTGTLRGG